MEGVLTYSQITSRLQKPWLLPYGNDAVSKIAHEAFLCAKAAPAGAAFLLASQNPVYFFGHFLGIIAAGRPLALIPLDLTAIQKKEVLEKLKPAFLAQERIEKINEPQVLWPDYEGAILIPTGGSGGQLKWAMHTWETLVCAANGVLNALKGDGASFSALPFYHVSGLMPAIRAWVGGGTYWVASVKESEKELSALMVKGRWASLVPTQLERLLMDDSATRVLQSAQIIFLGGGRAHESLLEKARKAKLPIGLTYGMTEIAGMVTLSSAEAFLSKDYSLGRILPHAKIFLKKGDRLSIEADSCFCGYFPDAFNKLNTTFETMDRGVLDKDGRLLYVSRLDNMLICGGEKIDPAWIESLIISTGQVKEVCVKGEADPEWGEVSVAYWVPAGSSVEKEKLIEFLKEKVQSRYVPKKWVELKTLPRTAVGKINKAALQ